MSARRLPARDVMASAAHDLWGGRKMQSERLHNGSSVRLGDLGMMVLQFFGGLVSVLLATILGALFIGLGGLSDEVTGLAVYAGLILAFAGLAWFSFRPRAWMLLIGGVSARALGGGFFPPNLKNPLLEITRRPGRLS